MMGDHYMVQALHAAISRRNWQEVEHAANRIRDDRSITWPDGAHDKPMLATHDFVASRQGDFCDVCGYGRNERLKHPPPDLSVESV
ncbi:hypothetical protein ACVWZK_002932 [Bradyrhizobium sp. GM0.4]